MNRITSALMLALTLFTLQSEAARYLPSENDARAVKGKIRDVVFKITGVSGVGVGTCNDRTGELDYQGGDVYCVVISVQDEAAALRLRRLYPATTRIDEVIIQVDIIGSVTPRPRMSGGN
jgi:hypothetical protein